jgi:exodeoxyribonuclease III
MRIATWNINSIRVRLAHVLDWLTQQRPDVLCLQETKVVDAEFPYAELRAAGYHVAHVGQKAYNGVATLTRVAPTEVAPAPPGLDGEQKRAIFVSVGGVRVLNVYVPNGESVDSPKYTFKLAWYDALKRHVIEELRRHPRLALVGDFNVAPEERDVHDPKRWAGKVLFSEAERAALRALTDAGVVDVFRRFEQPPKSFSWWDYRLNGFERNWGLRIDHILCSAALAERCRRCIIDAAPRARERPSDHAPVLAEFDL